MNRGRKLKSGESAREAILKYLINIEFSSYRDAVDIRGSSHMSIFNVVADMKNNGEIEEIRTESGGYKLKIKKGDNKGK